MISECKLATLNWPPDVGLRHDALKTVAEFKERVCLGDKYGKAAG